MKTKEQRIKDIEVVKMIFAKTQAFDQATLEEFKQLKVQLEAEHISEDMKGYLLVDIEARIAHHEQLILQSVNFSQGIETRLRPKNQQDQ